MAPTLDHTIVHASDPERSARFLITLFDLPPAERLGHFTVVRIGPTSLDFLKCDPPISSRHFAFKVEEAEFDAVFERLMARKLPYWADPFHRLPQEINHWDDGRGIYFDDPDGHVLEVITRSYGSGGRDAKHPNPLLNAR